LDGRLLDASGQGAEGQTVVLVGASRSRQYSTTTGGGGAFRFEGVRHGTYALHLGSPQSPLVLQREVEVRASLTILPELLLPPLGELFIEVVDERGAPARMIPVSGWGEPAGSLSVQTDNRGCALARFLLPGWYTLVVAQAQHGQARERIEVRAAERAKLRLKLSR
jgi:hypothetical protein